MPDPFNLNRFVLAQQPVYERVIEELSNGCKQTHWMWFIFPQLKGLGFSTVSTFYGISGREEALAYLQHPILGQRLIQCCELVQHHRNKSALQIFGSPDHLKLHSCLTLFASAAGEGSIFEKMLEIFFEAKKDVQTERLLKY